MTRDLDVSTEPPWREKHLDLKRVKPGQSGFVRICSRKIFGYYSHWYQGHSHPCYGKVCDCPSPLTDLPREWHGVLHVFDVAKRREILLELTDKCCESLLDQVPDKKNLRGLRVRFYRSNDNAKGRLLCELDGKCQLDNDLPAEVNPRKTLDVIWASNSPVDLRIVAG